MTRKEKLSQRTAFIISAVVGTVFLAISLFNDLGFFSGKIASWPCSSWAKLASYLLGLILILYGLYCLSRFCPERLGSLMALGGWVASGVALFVFGSLRFGLGLALDKQSGTFGLVLAMLSLLIGFSFTLYQMENKIHERFDELQRQAGSKGFLVHVDDASLWHFHGTIVGWNPNWALELNTHPDNEFALQLQEVHKNRLESSEVHSIEYIFLKNYDPTGDGTLKFGAMAFLEFLNGAFSGEMWKEQRKRKGLHVERYSIWEIDEDIWRGCDEPMDAERKLLFDALKPFLNVIVIAGARNRRDHAVLFFNMPQFIDASGHTHCLEIPDDKFEFYASWHNIRDNLSKCNIQEQSVAWDKKFKKYTLVNRVSSATSRPPLQRN